MFRDECGAISFDFIPGGFVFHISASDSTQKIVTYDTVLEVLDTLLSVPYKNPFSDNHRGGSVIYDNGTYYCSFGYGITGRHAQDLSDYRGKLLKIDSSGVNIVAFGLRNPYRFSFKDNEGFIADVGSNVAEEVNYFTGDYSLLNMQWPCFEGDSQLLIPDTLCDGYSYSSPEFTYSKPESRSIIGGCFWNDNYYFCDHFKDSLDYVFGGYLDSNWIFHDFPISFPQFVTSMTVNHLNELVVSTWLGNIYEYVDGPLSIDSIPPDPEKKLLPIIVTSEKIIWNKGLNGRIMVLTLEGQIVRYEDAQFRGSIDIYDLVPRMYIAVLITPLGVEWRKKFVTW